MVPPDTELAGGVTPKISIPPCSQRKPTGLTGDLLDSDAVGGESHADAGPPALFIVCASTGGSHFTIAPEIITAGDAATSVPATDADPPAMVAWHHSGARPSAAAAPPAPPPDPPVITAAAAASASINIVTWRLPPASADAGAATALNAAERPFLSAVASSPSPFSTHVTLPPTIFKGSAALYVNECAHVCPGILALSSPPPSRGNSTAG